MHVRFRSGALELEGDVVPAAARAVVVCHPHPQYGGDMDNPVVVTVAEALQAAGYATLRFNFRGVGSSGGSYDGGVGEQDDARAAAAFLCEQTGASQVTLAGYSFGAMVALQVGVTLDAADRVIAVAPPLTFFDLSRIAGCAKAKWFVAGDGDAYCPLSRLQQAVARMVEPVELRVIAGADHFFAGTTQQLSAAIGDLARAA